MLSRKEIDTVKEQAYGGFPYNFRGICKIYPQTMGEVLEIGSHNYNIKLNTLLLTETDIAKIIKEKTKQEPDIEKIYPLSYLLQSAENDDMFLLELQSAFSTFIKEDILLLPKINAVLIGSPEQKRLITEENFSDFQTVLRLQNRKEIKTLLPENESAIARKFRLKREYRDEIKRKQKSKNGEEQPLDELLEIAETFKIDYLNKTLYAFYGLVRRHQAREKWQQDIQMLCAGADPQKLKSKYWGESLEEK